ncbi:hypothetical protein Sango_0794200 [Sesamum angolense]|uniref:Reverse transcriptase domain-containing protein n=1 Tax=Sesamum angolense TaxID=2727404 RepID=A0AAE2C088_9LAMI|nr:hypothetical protein Sango_0794200 [Sesamum angolense]
MWEKLLELGQSLSMPWLVLSNFNYVKSPVEKQLGVPLTRLDQVLLNNDWLEAGLHCATHFNPTGCFSDYFSSIVSIFYRPATEPKPFRFFNILHYSHTSVKAKEADIALQDVRNHVESNPGDAAVRDSLGDFRKKTVFLPEAERHFYYQKAKIHFLKQGDQNTKFFHDMVKRNAARNSILAVTKSDDDDVFEWRLVLSLELALDLCRAITPAKVKLAVFQFSNNKVPGPGGYTSCFFKKAWNIVSDLVCKTVMDFFRSGQMLRQLNHTIIALVPKSEHSTSVADYRSISCCNVIYKVITKIIANRLSPPLEHLIECSQTTFVGGRNITYNIFLAHKIVGQYSKKRISPRCTISVDLHKAFDSGKKGLRQGDPISPALFLLCMEFFSHMIKRNTLNSNFNFHPKCEKLMITHLFFTDNLMMFSLGDLSFIHILMKCLQEFRDVSGLAVNTSKSSIFTAGIQNDVLDGILARMEFARGNMLVRYLRIPVAAKRLLITDYLLLVDQIVGCIGKWTTRVFLWKSKRAPVAWEEIFHPKEEGGLGILHIQSSNIALLARVLWNIHRKTAISWVKWINVVYLRGTSLWYWQLKKGDSPLIQRLADIKDRVVTAFGSLEAAVQRIVEWSNNKGLETSKAYEYFRPKLTRQPWKAAICKAFIPPKYSFILWLGLWESLQICDRLVFLQEESLCSLCINMAKHHPTNVNPSQCGQVAQEREDWILCAE